MQQSPESPRLRRWALVLSLTSCVGTSLGIIFLLGILLPDIANDLDLSPSEQGWLGSSVLIANLIFCIPINLVTSLGRPWRTISLLFLGVGLFTLLQSWSPLLAVLVIGRIATGLCFTATQAPRALIIQQWIPRHRISFTNGLVFAGIDLIMGLVFLVTPQIHQMVGSWRETLLVWSLISLGITAIWLVVGGERVNETLVFKSKEDTQTPLTSVLKNRKLWVMGISIGGAMVAQSGFATFWPTLAEDKLGISGSFAGLTLGVMTFAAAPTDFLVNALPSLVKRRSLVLASCGIASTVAYIGLTLTTSSAVILLLGILRGFAFAYFPALMIMVFLMEDIKPREVGIGLAFMETSIWIGAGIGPLLVGFIQESTGNLQLALLICSMSPLILIVSAFILKAWEGNSPTNALVSQTLTANR